MEVERSAALRKSLSERRHTLSHESKYVNEVFVNNRIVRMSALIKSCSGCRMLIHPQFDPIAFSIGPLGVHWYGLMYLLGFLAFWLLGRRRAQDYWRGVTPDDVENLLFWGVLALCWAAGWATVFFISLRGT